MGATVHEQVIQNMKEMAAKFAESGISLQMPPPSNLTLGTQYVAIDFGKMLAAQINYDQRFTNPIRTYQGGFLCAGLDEVYGPLTYMAAGRPVVTIEMSTTFLRPFTAKDEFVTIKAEVVAKTKNLIVLKAEVHSKGGKLIATSSNHSMIVTDESLSIKR